MRCWLSYDGKTSHMPCFTAITQGVNPLHLMTFNCQLITGTQFKYTSCFGRVDSGLIILTLL